MASEQVQNSAKSFYKDKLSDRLEENHCENGECVTLKKSKYSERLELQEKLRRNEAAISTCEETIRAKETMIKESEEKLKGLMINGSSNADPFSKIDQKYLLSAFQQITDSYTLVELNDLSSFSLDKKRDASFITEMVKLGYNNRIDDLKTKTITGSSKSNIEKSAISPEKLSLWRNMFQKRLYYSGSSDSSARLKRFRQLVNSSIQNITRGPKIRNLPDEDCVTIVISNSENDLLVLKKIQKTLSVENLKVLFWII